MTAWKADELRRISETDDPHASPFRQGGVRHWHGATPTTAMTHTAVELRAS